jgi:CheY-specific phosphatase CheX
MNERVTEILSAVAIETLKRLAFLFSFPQDDNNRFMSNSMAASISFKGPFSGRLVMKMSALAALELSANMLGIDEIDEEKATIEQQSDAIKETLNVICGNLLPVIGGNRVEFCINAPQIISQANDEEGTPENKDEGMPFAMAKLLIDEEPCELYMFVDGDASSCCSDPIMHPGGTTER